MKISNLKNIIGKQLLLFIALAVITIALIVVMSLYLPQAVDWHGAFRPAALEILHGRSPYNADGFYHAPWSLIPLFPLAMLPEPIGRAILVLITLISYAYIALRIGAKPIAIIFLLLSPPVLHLVINGNLDWLAAFGFILPPQWGLFFIAIKPQMGIAVAPFWLIEAWRKGGLKLVIKTFAPFTIILLLSFVVFGLWPLGSTRTTDLWWNASLWPISIPVGLALFVTSIRKRKIEFAMAASPCLSPYVLLHSWVGALLAIVASVPETIAAVTGLWALVILRLIAQ